MGNGARYVDPGEKTNWKYLLCRREGCRSIATVLAACSSGGVDGLEAWRLQPRGDLALLTVKGSEVSDRYPRIYPLFRLPSPPPSPVAHIRGASFYGTGIGRTFEGKELESFVKEMENGLNLGREGKHAAALRQTYDRQKTGNKFDLAFAVGHPTAGDMAQEEAQVLAPVAPLMEVLAPVAPLAQAVLVALPMKNLREEIV
eukprot:gene14963-21019_t